MDSDAAPDPDAGLLDRLGQTARTLDLAARALETRRPPASFGLYLGWIVLAGLAAVFFANMVASFGFRFLPQLVYSVSAVVQLLLLADWRAEVVAVRRIDEMRDECLRLHGAALSRIEAEGGRVDGAAEDA